MDLDNFLSMCEYIWVPIKAEKTVQPSTVINFLDIELDFVSRMACLPQVKSDKIQCDIQEMIDKTSVSLTDSQSLIGLLNSAGKVFTPGRPFLRSLIALTMGIQNPKGPIDLDPGSKG